MKPNILMVMLDDLNAWIGALLSHPDVRTPNIDALAERGILFTRAYCGAPYCNPSRMSVMTGLLPSSSGIYRDEQIEGTVPERSTLPELLRKNGYYTFSVGKVFHGHYDYATAGRAGASSAEWRAASDRKHYWDEVVPPQPDQLPATGRPLNGLFDFSRFSEVPSLYHHFDWGALPDDRFEDMPDTKSVRLAQKFLRTSRRQPFFACVGIYKPHLPWYTLQRFATPYEKEYIWLPPVFAEDLEDVPPIGREWALSPRDHELVTSSKVWHQAVRGYLACITFADYLIGELLEALHHSPFRDNTYVILWSDNGFHLGEKLHWRKFALWEEATRVPLIIAPPKGLPHGVRVDQPVGLVDLYPTILELAGVSPGSHDGQSLRKLLTGGASSEGAVSIWGANNRSLRYRHWRYTLYSDGAEELYDRRFDAWEWRNLAGHPGYQNVRKELQTRLTARTSKK